MHGLVHGLRPGRLAPCYFCSGPRKRQRSKPVPGEIEFSYTASAGIDINLCLRSCQLENFRAQSVSQLCNVACGGKRDLPARREGGKKITTALIDFPAPCPKITTHRQVSGCHDRDFGMVQTWVARPESSKGVSRLQSSLRTPFEDSGRATRKSAFLNQAAISPGSPAGSGLKRLKRLKQIEVNSATMSLWPRSAWRWWPPFWWALHSTATWAGGRGLLSRECCSGLSAAWRT